MKILNTFSDMGDIKIFNDELSCFLQTVLEMQIT